MRKTSKWVDLVMSVCLLLSFFIPTAEASGTKKLTTKSFGGYYYNVTYHNANYTGIDGSNMSHMYLDGEVAFCVDGTVPLGTSDFTGDRNQTYTNALDAFTKKIESNRPLKAKMELAVYFGWTQSQKRDWDKAMTEMYLWNLIHGVIPTSSRGDRVKSIAFASASRRNEFAQFKASIDEKIRQVLEGNVSWHGTTVILRQGESKTLTDSSNVFGRFRPEKTEENGLRIALDGNQVTLTAAQDAPVGENTKFRFARTVFNGAVENPNTQFFICDANGRPYQRLATFQGVDPRSAEFTVEVLPAPRFSILKVDEKGQPVEGAELQLTEKASGSPVHTWVSRSEPELVTGLKPSTAYVLTELKTPSGYATAPAQEITSGTTAEPILVRMVNRPTVVRIEKQDADTKKPLAEARLQLVDTVDGRIVYEWISAAESQRITGLAVGRTYEIREAQAPAGYKKAEPKSFTVEDQEEEQLFTLENAHLLGKISLQKHELTHTGISLQGAEYQMILRKLHPSYTEAPWQIGTVMDTLTTDEKGRAISKDLPLGVYDVVETKAPEGYALNPVARQVELRQNDQTVEMAWGAPDTEALVKAYEAQIAQYQETLKKHRIEVREINPAKLAEDAKDFLAVHDKAKLGYLVLSKNEEKLIKEGDVEDHFLPEEGTSFELTKEDGTVIDTLVTNKEGRAASVLLPVGTYTLRQRNAPEGSLPIAPQTVTISDDGEVLSYLYTNEAVRTMLRLQKVDGESGLPIPLEGVVFSLYQKQEGGEALRFDGVDEFATDAKGEVTFPKALPFGTYYLEEKLLPDQSGYYLDPKGGRLEVTVQGALTNVIVTKTVEIPQVPQKGQLLLEKRGDVLIGTAVEAVEVGGVTYEVCVPQFEECGLSGVVFDVIAKEDITTKDGVAHYRSGDVVESLTTDGEGRAQTKELPLGKYAYVERSTRDGYLLSPEEVPFELTSETSAVRLISYAQTVRNERETLTIRFAKDFETSKWFAHEKEAPNETVFGLYNRSDLVVDGVTIPAGTCFGVTGLTNEGTEEVPIYTAFFSVRLAGEYELREVKTGEAYILGKSHEIDFATDSTASQSKETEVIPLHNALMPTELSVFKYDVTTGESLPLAGVEFTLFARAKEGDVAIGRYLTDKEGYLRVDGLEVGSYYLKETKGLFGYVRPEEGWVIDLSKEKPSPVIEISNEKTNIEISKQDATTGKELSGAKLKVVDEEGKVIAEWTSSDKPHLIRGLEVGKTYTLHEDLAPLGYYTSQSVSFTVQNTAEVQKVKMINDLTTVEISKQDATTGKELPGAKLKVVDEEGKVIAEWTSSDRPHLIRGLEVGKTYTLHEDLAPRGYALAQSVSFTVQDTGEVQKVVMEDALLPIAPQTGDVGVGALLLLGAFAMGGIVLAEAMGADEES